MLDKIHRLPSNTQLKNSRFYKTPLFAVKIAKNDQLGSRFAFLVRKKVDKRAVVRNRIRRVFRSCVEEMLGEIASGHDMLFFLERGIMEKRREELLEELKKFFEERGFIKL